MQLWQTSKSHQLGSRVQQLHDTWTKLNPRMPATVVNDTEAAEFIRGSFGGKVYDVYAAFPLNVMRADFWRYAVFIHSFIHCYTCSSST